MTDNEKIDLALNSINRILRKLRAPIQLKRCYEQSKAINIVGDQYFGKRTWNDLLEIADRFPLFVVDHVVMDPFESLEGTTNLDELLIRLDLIDV